MRRGKLDAVTITGGEPTIHDDLTPFIKKNKKNEICRQAGYQRISATGYQNSS